MITDYFLSNGSFAHTIYYAIANAILFYEVNRNRNGNRKGVVQPILEPIGNRNHIRVINLMCEWTLRSLYWRPICLANTAAI